MRLNATARNAALCLGLSTAGTLAGPFDGVYVPNPSGRAPDRSGCETVAILIAEDRLRYFEVRCALSNPVQIRAMEALLYDGQCSLDGSAKQGRAPRGNVIIRDGTGRARSRLRRRDADSRVTRWFLPGRGMRGGADERWFCSSSDGSSVSFLHWRERAGIAAGRTIRTPGDRAR